MRTASTSRRGSSARITTSAASAVIPPPCAASAAPTVALLSAGADTRSSTTYTEVRRHPDESDATVFTIGVGLGTGAAEEELRVRLHELADASGGLALFADDTDRLAASFAEIVETLANQYTISFEPQRDGKYHRLAVQVPDRDAKVRARRGYVAPKQ